MNAIAEALRSSRRGYAFCVLLLFRRRDKYVQNGGCRIKVFATLCRNTEAILYDKLRPRALTGPVQIVLLEKQQYARDWAASLKCNVIDARHLK